jgi:hypothetical protein
MLKWKSRPNTEWRPVYIKREGRHRIAPFLIGESGPIEQKCALFLLGQRLAPNGTMVTWERVDLPQNSSMLVCEELA